MLMLMLLLLFQVVIELDKNYVPQTSTALTFLSSAAVVVVAAAASSSFTMIFIRCLNYN